jgi:hypothetical protein
MRRVLAMLIVTLGWLWGATGCVPSYIKPLPPAPVASGAFERLTLLMRSDPDLELADEGLRRRAEARGDGRRLRQALEQTLRDAGVTIVRSESQPHDFEVRMVLSSVTTGGTAVGSYRLEFSSRGTKLVDVSWSWPVGTMVAEGDGYLYAARHLTSEMFDSHRLMSLLSREGAIAEAVALAEDDVAPSTSAPKSAAAPPATRPATRAGDRRIALVVGNAAYADGRLANPVNDARGVAAALRELGFEVTEKHDLDQKQLKLAIRAFGDELSARTGVGLFYFAGHGVQVNGRNYLIPVAAAIRSEAHVDVESVAVDAVLAELARAKNRLNIVVLDACRNNPYARKYRSLQRGLAFVDAPQGTLIAYATAPGSIADDGAGKHGTYTGALIRHMKTPGIPVESVFKAVRRDVQKATSGAQTPRESSSLTADFYFRPRRARGRAQQP